jgi:hypothetical protein
VTHEFKDLTRLTTVTTVVVAIYGTLDLIASVLEFLSGVPIDQAPPLVALLQVANFVALLACFITVGRWIYRASANAHSLSQEMTISPAWAVGWYFIPFANLVKPMHAMREIWLASHESDGSYEERVPILITWWTLWIVNNVLANLAWRFDDVAIGPTVDLVAAVANVPLCIILVLIMREIDSSQRYVRHAVVFA